MSAELPIQSKSSLRLSAIFALGFASGLPLILIGSTLQAWYTEAGLSVVTIGALSLIGLPYLWKFLWSPIMDRYTLFKGARRRGWLILTQLALSLALYLMSLSNPATSPKYLAILALITAFCSASQDIVVDAYRADILLPSERGLGSALFLLAYRLSILVAGGLALVLADHYGWMFTYQCMAFLFLLSAGLSYLAPEPKLEPASQNLWQNAKAAFQDLLQRDAVVMLILFIIFYKIADALAVSLITNFLLKGLGFSLTQVGFAYKTASLTATILGAFAASLALRRLNILQALWLFGILQAVSILALMFLAMAGKHMFIMIGTVFFENFCNGMGTTAFMVFLMGLCNHRYTATQYAYLSALTALGRVLLGPVAGLMVASIGWVQFFALSALLSLPGLFFLNLLSKRMNFDAKLVEC